MKLTDEEKRVAEILGLTEAEVIAAKAGDHSDEEASGLEGSNRPMNARQEGQFWEGLFKDAGTRDPDAALRYAKGGIEDTARHIAKLRAAAPELKRLGVIDRAIANGQEDNLRETGMLYAAAMTDEAARLYAYEGLCATLEQIGEPKPAMLPRVRVTRAASPAAPVSAVTDEEARAAELLGVSLADLLASKRVIQ